MLDPLAIVRRWSPTVTGNNTCEICRRPNSAQNKFCQICSFFNISSMQVGNLYAVMTDRDCRIWSGRSDLKGWGNISGAQYHHTPDAFWDSLVWLSANRPSRYLYVVRDKTQNIPRVYPTSLRMSDNKIASVATGPVIRSFEVNGGQVDREIRHIDLDVVEKLQARFTQATSLVGRKEALRALRGRGSKELYNQLGIDPNITLYLRGACESVLMPFK